VGAAVGISWASGRTLVLAELFAPVVGGVQSVTTAATDSVERVQALHRLEVENAELKKKVDALESLLVTRDEQAAENQRLHGLLKLQVPQEAEPKTVARVIGRNPDNWHQRVLLDKGTASGAPLKGVLLNQRGLIGHVVTTSPHTSLGALLTDPASAVPVINMRTRSAGVVVGQGDGWPVLRYMEQPEKWKVGDRLITSGLGSIYPKGILVGKIIRLKTAENTFFPELRVEPAVELERLEEVIMMPPGLAAMPTPTPKPTPKPSPSATPKG
ncbi:MAG: rod shape-determining protein MreC, partial [Candidatus Sericytochromatia bacterium]